MPRTRYSFLPLSSINRFAEYLSQRKFNVPVTALLLRSNLIPFQEQDAQLAKLILRDMKPSTINFTANLIRDSLLGNAPYASRDRFRLSLEALSRCVQERKSTEV